MRPILRPIVSPLLTAIASAAKRSRPWSPADLFKHGESGAWWSARDQFSVYERYYSTYAWRGSGPGLTCHTGIVLDRSTWGRGEIVDILGPDLVVNGNFSTDASWTKGEGWSIVDGVATRTTAAGSSNLTQSGILTVGETYLIEIDVASIAGGNLRVFAGSGGTMCQVPSTTPAGTTLQLAVKCGGSTALILQSIGAAGTVSIDRVSCRAIQGTHALQQTEVNCPSYMAGGYLVHEAGESLTASFGSAPGPCTVVTSTITGVEIEEQVSVGAEFVLPTDNWFDVLVVDRALSPAEKARLTQWLGAARDHALTKALAIWGDSYASGSGVSGGAQATWGYLLQREFVPGRPRMNAGASGSTVAEMADRVAASDYYKSAATIFWDKKNAAESVSEWLSALDAAIGALGHERFVVLTPVNGTGEGEGTAYYDDVMYLIGALNAAYPGHILDMRAYLVGQAIYDAEIVPTEDDLLDIAADTIPRSLLSDGVHINDAAQRLVAIKVAQFIRDAGW